jgi:hypothetical protein
MTVFPDPVGETRISRLLPEAILLLRDEMAALW